MKYHSRTEYEQNERDMLALFRKLDWREQVILIGRMEVITEQAELEEVIQFPTGKTVHRRCIV